MNVPNLDAFIVFIDQEEELRVVGDEYIDVLVSFSREFQGGALSVFS